VPVIGARIAGFGWLGGSLVLVCIAQLSLKYAMANLPGEPGLETYLAALGPGFWLPVLAPILLGMFCYGLSIFFWLATLGHLPLSMAYPLLSLSYLLVALLATLLFNETMSLLRLLGIALLLLGSVFVALPAREVAR